jgi:hypothetical protein
MTSAQTSPARATDASAKPRPKLLAALRKPVVDSSESEAESENEASVSEDDATPTTTAKPSIVTRPEPATEHTNEEDESDGEDAYELMKKRLAANKSASTSHSAGPQEPPHEAPILARMRMQCLCERTPANRPQAGRRLQALEHLHRPPYGHDNRHQGFLSLQMCHQ